MTRRFAVLVIAAVAGVGLASPAWADRGPDHDWACVFVTELDQGYCQQNPLPDRPPTTEDVARTADWASASASTATAPEAPEAPTPSL